MIYDIISGIIAIIIISILMYFVGESSGEECCKRDKEERK